MQYAGQLQRSTDQLSISGNELRTESLTCIFVISRSGVRISSMALSFKSLIKQYLTNSLTFISPYIFSGVRRSCVCSAFCIADRKIFYTKAVNYYLR